MIESSKPRNYHIREILYNLYEDNIFHNKKEMGFFSITSLSFIKYKANFGHYMELIDAAVNPDHISTLKKQFNKAELKKKLS